MIISGKKLLEILEEFQKSKPKKEERISYEEWRNLVKFLTESQETEFSVSTDTPILKIHEPQTGYNYRFIVGSYFLNFFKARTIDYKISVTSSTPPIINDPMEGKLYAQDSSGKWTQVVNFNSATTTFSPEDTTSNSTSSITFPPSNYNSTPLDTSSYLRINGYGELEYYNPSGWEDPTPSASKSSKNLNENLSKGSSNKMNINLNNFFDFGPMNDGNVMYSPYGLAFRNSNNQYLTYNPPTKKTTDVTGLTIDLEGLIYKVPVGLNSVKPGDIIIHNGKPICVEGIEDHSVICVDIENSELKTVIPPTNIFGFNYVTKITPLFNLGTTNPSADNPFGNIMPYLLFSTLNGGEGATKSKNGFDMQTLLLMSLLNGNADGNFFGNIFGNGQA